LTDQKGRADRKTARVISEETIVIVIVTENQGAPQISLTHQMPQNKQTLFFGVLLAVSLVSCGQVLFQESQTVPNKNWEIGNNITFDVEVKDTMVGYDFYIDLRNEANYPYANIYMFVNTIFPSGKSAKDTVECILADRTGRWLGNGLGDVIDNHILFKENIRFPNKGTYSFAFEQGMRNEALPAIIDVGISIEKHTKK
jgi:gliding motility-associated lipoprotein GldH